MPSPHAGKARAVATRKGARRSGRSPTAQGLAQGAARRRSSAGRGENAGGGGPRRQGFWASPLGSSLKWGSVSATFICLVLSQHLTGIHETYYAGAGTATAGNNTHGRLSMILESTTQHQAAAHTASAEASGGTRGPQAQGAGGADGTGAEGAALDGTEVPEDADVRAKERPHDTPRSAHAHQSLHHSRQDLGDASLAQADQGQQQAGQGRTQTEEPAHTQTAGQRGRREGGVRHKGAAAGVGVRCDECEREVARFTRLKMKATAKGRQARRRLMLWDFPATGLGSPVASRSAEPEEEGERLQGSGRSLLAATSRSKKKTKGRGRGGSASDEEGDSDAALRAVNAELAQLRQAHKDLRTATELLAAEVRNIQDMLAGTGTWKAESITRRAIEGSVLMLSEGCSNVLERERRKLRISAVKRHKPLRRAASWKGYSCAASPAELQRYMAYEARGLCPDDWFFVQNLIFFKDCFALPPRRCFVRTPAAPSEPMPLPQALFDQGALKDENVRWGLHQCKSFHCLNTRSLGDCRNCFNMSLEAGRWQVGFRGAPRMRDVIAMKNGSLRLGLDAGGGTGSFAAHMARYGVTVLTSAMNYETVKGRHGGLPYFETIAARGLIPLFLPHKARLPFFDNTLDVIHNVNTVKYMPILDFQDLVYEWDRVLRPGGIMWFEMFYAPMEEMPLYVSVLDLLGYTRLLWNLTPKTDRGERKSGAHVYLNCVIEKPARLDPVPPQGSRPEKDWTAALSAETPGVSGAGADTT